MKQINTFINEGQTQGYYCSDDLKNCKYALVNPYGLVELFTEDGLKKHIKELEDYLDDGDSLNIDEIEEDLSMYEELLSIDKTNIWVGLSGPARNDGEIKGVCGIKYK